MTHTPCTAALKSAPRLCWEATLLFLDLIGHFSYVPLVHLFVLDRTFSIPAYPILPEPFTIKRCRLLFTLVVYALAVAPLDTI
jgi:hypothetical protein